MTVVEYITEEVERQGHNTRTLDGIERVGWMLNAWSYAMSLLKERKPLVAADILLIGQKIEPHKNIEVPRKVDVWVGRRACPAPDQVTPMLADLMKRREGLEPLQFYRALLEIHPFVDGNGRTGKVVLNFLNGTLDKPIFPPDDFWGTPIRNP